MEFNILKTIETPVAYQNPVLSQLHSPYPDRDYVNPGIGGATRIFDVFVPIYYEKPTHCSNKAVDQQGFGALTNLTRLPDQETKTSEQKESEDQLLDENSKERKDESSKDEPESKIEIENERKRKLLGNDIFEAFMHPVIKTTRLTLASPKLEENKAEKKTISQSSKTLTTSSSKKAVDKSKLIKPTKGGNHKFKII